MEFLFFIISFGASIIGAICGIGGGVIIKPVLELTGSETSTVINFLSGCTVLSMSMYSVSKSLLKKEGSVDTKTGTPLAIGAAVGGVCGKYLFSLIKSLAGNDTFVGGVQAVSLGMITVGTLLYTVNKAKIEPRRVKNAFAYIVIGLLLGIMSSFLGIGGGPINLVVLYFFLGMDTKTAAANSLYIILFSQLANLVATLVSGVPEFNPLTLALMVAGGIGGGIVGRAVNKEIDNKTVDKLFIGLMSVIILICVYNTVKAFVL